MDDVGAMMDAARVRLRGAPREDLGRLIHPRRILGIPRAPKIVPAGAAWHLGALLITDREVLATGRILRAREEARRGFTAVSQRDRDALMSAAFRGGFAEGRTVHVGWETLDLALLSEGGAAGPILVRDGVARIRWSGGAETMPLRAYLDDHIALLLDPPQGAT